jgi:oligosaccharide repeat unit polymerase
MDLFFLYTGYIAFLAVVAVGVSLFYHNDTLHPAMLTLPAACFIYVYLPVDLYTTGELTEFFRASELQFVQGLNALCLTALLVGLLLGSRGLRRDNRKRDVHFLQLTPAWKDRLFTLALVLGGIGFLLYAYNLSNAGGFVTAYSRPKGGGHAASGYLRDFTILTLPAIVLLYMSRFERAWRLKDTVLIVLFSAPHLVHGLLSARRGPTFLGIATLVGGWYLTRYRRPAMWKVAAGGVSVGILLLFLVTFRGQIYLGSDLFANLTGVESAVTRSVESTTEASYGNEFIYGSKAVLLIHESGRHFWGTRYLTHVFVRPIPGFLWPTKYQDVGMEAMLFNAGVVREEVAESESIPPGAAPGFVADFYVEFRWGAILAILCIGFLFGALWRAATIYGGVWTVLYATIFALSLYFVSQTFGAFLFRALEVLVPTYIAWRYVFRKYVRETSTSRPRPMTSPSPS